MRLWHYQLLSYIPRQQLLSQLRECVAISKDIYETGRTNHILINKIMDYPIDEFQIYCDMVIDEMLNRGYKVSDATLDKLSKYLGYKCHTKSIPDDVQIFKDWNNLTYLVICIYNLREKYLCSGVTDNEWDKIYHKFYRYIDY